MNVRPTSYRSVASDAYDEYDATVRVPKGEKLAQSRDTPGAHRGFTHSGDWRMEHAEIFLKGESKRQPAPKSRTREQEEFDELLRALVMHGLVKAAEAASRYIKRWWNGQTPASIAGASQNTRPRTYGRSRQPRPRGAVGGHGERCLTRH